MPSPCQMPGSEYAGWRRAGGASVHVHAGGVALPQAETFLL